MNINHDAVGTSLPPVSLTLDPERLRFFDKATGGTPDRTADPRVPPTFLMSVELAAPDPFDWLKVVNVDLANVLHAEQSFVYRAPCRAGDTVTARSRISDIREKRGGALTFITKETEIVRPDGEVVAELKTVIVSVRKEAS